ncbi:MAG: EVE domain-containing protein [Maioricimonas sp. JB049]
MAKRASTSRSARRRYWLFKSEPSSYSIDDLAAEPDRTTFWDGVRNYQARNMLRDDVQVGDRVLFYHSNARPMAIAGTCEVVKAAYPDHTAFAPDDHHYDPKSDPDNPTWFMVDVKLIQKFDTPVTRDMLKECDDLTDMMVLKRGSRLSIQPVTAAEWKVIHKLAGARDR